jgi:hypothetical protein
MFSADMANEEWEVEISPGSRYDTEGEFAPNSQSTPVKKDDLRAPFTRAPSLKNRGL